jgi:hypothetical protein
VSSDKDLSSDDFDSVIVLSFSNLCTGREDVLIDKEFAGFYELLIDPPDPAKRLVPQVIGIGPEVPRFGDCFLNAKISE